MIETTVRGRVNQSQPGTLGEMVEHGARGRRVTAKNDIPSRGRLLRPQSARANKQEEQPDRGSPENDLHGVLRTKEAKWGPKRETGTPGYGREPFEESRQTRLRRIQKFSRRQVMSEAQAAPATKTLFTAEFLQDPYPAYRRFLGEGRVHSVDYGGGMWAVFKHAECSAIIRDPRLSARRTGSLLYALPADKRDEFAELARMLGLWMLFFDAPEHTRLRKLMNKGFSPAVAEALRPQVEAIVERMLEPLRQKSEADILQEIAYPLPVRVIAEMLGLPETLHERFIQWSDALVISVGNPRRTLEQTRLAQEAV